MLHGLIEKQATVPTAVKQWRNLVSMHADGGVVSHATAPANVASIVSSGRILPSAAPGRTQHGPGAYFLNSPEPAWSHGRAALAVSGSSGAARGLEAVRDGVMRTAGGAFPLARRDTFIAGGHNPVVRSAQDVAQRAGMRVVAPEVARSFAERVTHGAGLGLDNEAKRRLVRALRGKEAAAPVVSKEKHRALQRVDAHFAAERPNWDAFVQHAKRKSFVKALAADPRADATLRRHVEQMHQLHAGKRVKTVTGVSGKYQVVKKPQGGLACTCPDWRYRRSVMFGADQKCKHIHAYEASQEKSAGLFGWGRKPEAPRMQTVLVGGPRHYHENRREYFHVDLPRGETLAIHNSLRPQFTSDEHTSLKDQLDAIAPHIGTEVHMFSREKEAAGVAEGPRQLKDVRWGERKGLLQSSLSRHLRGLPGGITATPEARRGLGFMAPNAEIHLRDAQGKNVADEDNVFSQGAAAVSLRRSGIFRPSWDLEADALYLKPEYQGKGVGSRVFGGIVNAARDMGARRVTLRADGAGKAVWAKMPGVEFLESSAREAPAAYAEWARRNGAGALSPAARPHEYPSEFLRDWSPGPVGFVDYQVPLHKAAAGALAGAALGGLVGAAREYTKQRPERDAYRVHGDLGHVAPDVLDARARGRLGRVMLAGAGGAALGGLAGHGLQRAVPAVQGAARAAAHDIGHHLGRGAVEGARADLGASPPSGWLWRKMLQGIAPAEKAAGVGDNIAAMRALSAVTSPKTVAKSVSKTMGRLGTLTQKAPSGAVPPSGGV